MTDNPTPTPDDDRLSALQPRDEGLIEAVHEFVTDEIKALHEVIIESDKRTADEITAAIDAFKRDADVTLASTQAVAGQTMNNLRVMVDSRTQRVSHIASTFAREVENVSGWLKRVTPPDLAPTALPPPSLGAA